MAETDERPEARGGLAKVRAHTHPVVFGVSFVVIVAFVILTAAFTDRAGELFGEFQGFAVEYGGWWLTLVVAALVVFVLFLGFSRFGRIRLGADDERPEFNNWQWFSMLFSAGMGIGLVFWAVSEPIWHYVDPPRAEPESVAAAEDAMIFTFFHWGLHAWAIYIVMALALAYMTFRKGRPLAVRYGLEPLVGTRLVEGWLGHIIDILAVFGTIFGIATSLGLGVSQVNAGLARLGILEVGDLQAVLLIAIITAIATTSVVSGLHKGIKWLSSINISVAAGVMVVVLLVGPTLVILNALVENIGGYLQNIIEISLETDALGDGAWQAAWPTFYWAWWISWSPFVGMFIARISKGRTIREFVFGVLFVPTLVSMVWLTVFGNAGLFYELQGIGDIAAAAQEDEAEGTLALLATLPIPDAISTLLIAVITIVVVLFFVTSSDSGSLVIDILTSKGELDPPVATRVFWAVAEGAVAAVLLLAGGLSALQTASISTGLPFSLVLAALAVSMWMAFRRDPAAGAPRMRRRPAEAAAGTSTAEGPPTQRDQPDET